jgi:flavin reductase (DIM6/NTAB) family NADH-FMN oxidoreductase RutF
MDRGDMGIFDHYDKIIDILGGRGLLLAAHDKNGKSNAMTIGWAALGKLWSMPVWMVMVRPSRYTYECIEHSRSFSVNVPGPELKTACAVCGGKSGRTDDKLALAKLTAVPGAASGAPVIEQCPIIYECKVVHWNDVVSDNLVPDLRQGAYPKGDFHRLYFGMVLSAQAANGAELLL